MSVIPSPISIVPAAEPERLSLDEALARISSRAHGLDAAPRLPRENLDDLRAAGMLQLTADRAGAGARLREEIALVRTVARADASTARIFDGHLNGVERLGLGAPAWLREAELRAHRRREAAAGGVGRRPGTRRGGAGAGG